MISDRYLVSGLVIQRFDGVDPVFLRQLNENALRLDLAVILDADPDLIAERLSERGLSAALIRDRLMTLFAPTEVVS